MASSEKVVKIEALVQKITPKAVLIEHEGEKVWLPRSQLIDDEQLEEGREQEIKMLPWIANEKGLV